MEKIEQLKMILQENSKTYINISMKLNVGEYENIEVNVGKTIPDNGIELDEVFDKLNIALENEIEKLKEVYGRVAIKKEAKKTTSKRKTTKQYKTKQNKQQGEPASEKQKNFIHALDPTIDVSNMTRAEADKTIKELLGK